MTSSDNFVALPPRLSRLPELAYDLWWIWNPARELFRRLDYNLWRQSAHNPVRMLREISAEALARALADPVILGLYDEAMTKFDRRAPAKVPGGSRTSTMIPTTSSRISAPSSRCTSRCRFTPAAWACWQGTTARKRATWAFRSSAWASCIRRATFANEFQPTAGSRKSTSGSTGPRRPSRTLAPLTAKTASCSCRSARGRCSCGCGKSASRSVRLLLLDTDLEAERSRGTVNCPPASTAAARTRACSRKSCSASAACSPFARSASSRRPGI